MWASSVNTFITSKLWRRPTSKSFGSCAGVILTAPVPNSFSTYSSATIGISLFIIGSTTVFPIRWVYLSSSGWTATAVSPSIVSGLVVATIISSFPSGVLYLICHKCPASSSYSTSASEIDVIHLGHQLIILSPLYICPLLYMSTNTFFTAFVKCSSIVKLTLDQSQETPIFLSWFSIVPPYFSFQAQALSKNFSLPKSSLVMPSLRICSTIFASVAILAWSIPGTHKVSKPCILLYLTIISWSVLSIPCPICKTPVIFGGGITIVKGFLSESLCASKYLFPSQLL